MSIRTTWCLGAVLLMVVGCLPCLAGESVSSITVGGQKAVVQIADGSSHSFSFAYQPQLESGRSQLEIEITDDDSGLIGAWSYSEETLLIVLNMGGAPVEIQVGDGQIAVDGTTCEGISAECVAKLLRPYLEGVTVEMLIATLAVLREDLADVRYGEEIVETFHILIEDRGVQRASLPKTEKLHTK